MRDYRGRELLTAQGHRLRTFSKRLIDQLSPNEVLMAFAEEPGLVGRVLANSFKRR